MKTTIQQKVNHEALSLISNITYAQVPGWFGVSGRDLRMSVICPKIVPGHEKLPVVLWICGGAYLDVDENVWMPQMVHLARRGFIIASAQYRTSNQAAWPAPLTDVKSAVRYLRANAERYAIDPKRVYVTGLRPHEMYSIPKMMWIREHQPEIYEAASYIFMIEDFVVYHLTGMRQIDYSLASRSMAFDISKLVWSQEIFDAAGMDTGKMSRPVPTGTDAGPILPAAR